MLLDPSAALQQAAQMGTLQIPIRVRAAPVPPAVNGQSAAAHPVPQSPSLDDVKRWDYSFAFDHPIIAQDTRYVAMTFNGSAYTPGAAPVSSQLQPLFDALAQATSALGQVQADLDLLPLLAPGTTTLVCATAVSVIVDLVHQVTSTWPEESSLLAAEPAGVTVEYQIGAAVINGAPGLTLTLTTAPAAGVAWPELYVGAPVEANHLAGQIPAGDRRDYVFVGGQTAGSAYAWVFESLDVTQLQSGVAAVWVVRSRDLANSSGPSVNDAFVFATAVAEPSGPVIPLLIPTEPLPLAGSSVSAALEATFSALFGATWSATVKFAGRYGYDITPGITSELPMFVVSNQALSSVTTADAMTATACATAIALSWRAGTRRTRRTLRAAATCSTSRCSLPRRRGRRSRCWSCTTCGSRSQADARSPRRAFLMAGGSKRVLAPLGRACRRGASGVPRLRKRLPATHSRLAKPGR